MALPISVDDTCVGHMRRMMSSSSAEKYLGSLLGVPYRSRHLSAIPLRWRKRSGLCGQITCRGSPVIDAIRGRGDGGNLLASFQRQIDGWRMPICLAAAATPPM